MLVQVYHQLLGFSCINLSAVLLAPGLKILVAFSVILFIFVVDETDNGSVIQELLRVAVCGIVGKVSCVD